MTDNEQFRFSWAPPERCSLWRVDKPGDSLPLSDCLKLVSETRGAVAFTSPVPRACVPNDVVLYASGAAAQKDADCYAERDGQTDDQKRARDFVQGMVGEAALWAILQQADVDSAVPYVGPVPSGRRRFSVDCGTVDCKTVERSKFSLGWVFQRSNLKTAKGQTPVALMAKDAQHVTEGVRVWLTGIAAWGFVAGHQGLMRNSEYSQTKFALYPSALRGGSGSKIIQVSGWESEASSPDWDAFLEEQERMRTLRGWG